MPVAYLLPSKAESMDQIFWIAMFLRLVYGYFDQGELPESTGRHGFTIITKVPVLPSHQKRLGLIPLEDL